MATILLLVLMGFLHFYQKTTISYISLLGLGILTICYQTRISRDSNSGNMRGLLSSLFGLIHGFGFAGALIQNGLPTSGLVSALLGFNLGVEIGQFAIITGIILLSMAGRQIIRQKETVYVNLFKDVLASVLLCVGIFWFVERSI